MTLQDIQQSFYSRSFGVESIRWWLAGLGVVILFLVTLQIIKSLRASKVRYSPHGCITDSKKIRSALRSAFDQRRPFEMQIEMEQRERCPTLRCSPEHLASDSLTFEVNGLKSLSSRWLGKAVTVFFRIQAGKEFLYYAFPSHISGIYLPTPDKCQLTLPMPTRIENRQKRSFLRITPPHEFFPGAAIWYGAHFPKDENLASLAAWPRPALLFSPERMEQFSLIDLSAGGARICVPRPVIKLLQLQFHVSEHLILMLDLLDPEQNKRLRYWMECRIQNVWVEYVSRDVHLGVQFLSWARPCDIPAPGKQPSDDIRWLKLTSSSDVEPVGNWVMRRHLGMFRPHQQDPF